MPKRTGFCLEAELKLRGLNKNFEAALTGGSGGNAGFGVNGNPPGGLLGLPGGLNRLNWRGENSSGAVLFVAVPAAVEGV